jgi:hypothetical protein
MSFETHIFTFAAIVLQLVGCASFEQINACNKQAYQQAPPIYDSRQMHLLMQCPFGVGPFGPMFSHQGVTPQPFYCHHIEIEDLNYWARRSIFDACMKGVTSTTILPEPAAVAAPHAEPVAEPISVQH